MRGVEGVGEGGAAPSQPATAHDEEDAAAKATAHAHAQGQEGARSPQALPVAGPPDPRVQDPATPPTRTQEVTRTSEGAAQSNPATPKGGGGRGSITEPLTPQGAVRGGEQSHAHETVAPRTPLAASAAKDTRKAPEDPRAPRSLAQGTPPPPARKGEALADVVLAAVAASPGSGARGMESDLPASPPPGGGGGVSRATKAQIQLTDLPHKKPRVARPFPRKRLAAAQPAGKAEPTRSEDNLADDVVIQLLAIRKPGANPVPSPSPSSSPSASMDELTSLFFTFSFFDFGEEKTRAVALEPTGNAELYRFKSSKSESALRSSSSDLNEGLTFKYRIDGTDHYPFDVRRAKFVEYAKAKRMAVHVWNAQSLMLEGCATFDLAPLLRQGKDFVEHLQEVTIVGTAPSGVGVGGEGESVKEDAAGHGAQSVGALIVRLVNIGSERCVTDADLDISEINVGLRSLLEKPEPIWHHLQLDAADYSTHPTVAQLLEVERRKCVRKENLFSDLGDAGEGLEGLERMEGLEGLSLQAQIRERLHADVQHFKEMRREELVGSKLRDSLVTRRTFRTTLGSPVFFEHALANKTRRSKTLEVRIQSDRLSLVRDMAEWKHLRAMTRMRTSLPEEDLFDGQRLFLGVHDECHVPFKYQCLSSLPPLPGGGEGEAGRGSNGVRRREVILVSFVAEDTQLVESQLEVEIELLPSVVDRTLHLRNPLLSAFTHRYPVDGYGTDAKLAIASVISGDAGVIARVEDIAIASPHAEAGAGAGDAAAPARKDVVIKCARSDGHPGKRTAFLFFFADRYCAQLVGTWQLNVESVKKVELSGTTGQVSHASLIVKGKEQGSSSRLVRCYTSHPYTLRVEPREFSLGASSLAEVVVSYRPMQPGKADMHMNVVDVLEGTLVQSFLICGAATPPQVSREVQYRLRAGTARDVAVPYRNPWSIRKQFTFTSSLPGAGSILQPTLDLEGGAEGAVTMAIMTKGLGVGPCEFLVFVNDEGDNNEDCFRYRCEVVA